jgi:hypothetical protein
MTSGTRLWIGLAAGAMALGCGGLPFFNKAVKIDFTPPPATLYNRDPFDLAPVALDKKGKPLEKARINAVVAPPEVAVVVGAGELRCLTSGDAKITFTHEDLTQAVPFSCRMVSAVEIAATQEVEVERSAEINVTVKDEAGNAIPDVPAALSTSAPEIVAVEGTRLTGVKVGRAVVTATVEGREGSTTVDVVRVVTTDSLMLDEGASKSWTLPEGSWRVRVNATGVDGSPAGVVVAWAGTGCQSSGETPQYAQDCYVPSAGTLIVTNPTVMNEGVSVGGNVQLIRIPAEAMGQ